MGIRNFRFWKNKIFRPGCWISDFPTCRIFDMSLGSWESGFGLDLEMLTGYFRVTAIFGLYGSLRPPKMFSIGPILGFRPDFGLSEM